MLQGKEVERLDLFENSLVAFKGKFTRTQTRQNMEGKMSNFAISYWEL